MRILFIVEHYFPYIGGAEELWKVLAESLVKGGDDVKVITTLFRKDLPNCEAINGVEVMRLDVFNRFGFTFLSIPKCIKYARWADIIHTSSYNAALPARIAAWATGTKSVITFHEVWGRLWFKLPFITLPERIAFSLFEKIILKLDFDAFIGVSQFTIECLKRSGLPERKISLVYNGLDYNDFFGVLPKVEQRFSFCFFGRPGVSKGLDILIPAFIKISKVNEEVDLKMIISKEPRKIFQWVKRKIDRAGISNRVTFFHELPRKDLFKEVASSSAIIIPSHSEGFCFVAAEAVALGMPIISSGRGALKEVVSGEMIVMENLDIKSLSNAMNQALQGKWDRKPLRKFKLSDSINGYRKIYGELCNAKKNRLNTDS